VLLVEEFDLKSEGKEEEDEKIDDMESVVQSDASVNSSEDVKLSDGMSTRVLLNIIDTN